MLCKPSGSRRELPAAWLIAVVVAAIAAACSEGGDGTRHGLGIYVGAEWQGARGTTGHQVHVVEKQIPCAKCHELTDDSIGAVQPARCAACHAKEAQIEHAAREAQKRFGAAARADCTGCHAFAPEEHPVGDCRRCHGQKQGELSRVEVHASSECLRCHRPHENAKPESAPCPTCHSDVTTGHAAQGRSPSAACSMCHQQQHAPASAARSGCTACHAKQDPKVPASALFAEGHTECVGCHRPHEFEKARAVACRSCHEDVHVLGAPRVRAHSECNACHAPHDVRGSPERSCTKCHQNTHPDHSQRGAAGTCVGCHDPHPASARRDARARPCSGCHQVAASDQGFHGGTDCKRCHAPHDFVRALAEKPACESCHEKQIELVAAVTGHRACEGCHAGLPHRPRSPALGCDSCHAAERAAVHRGHERCTGCHEPHGGGTRVACKSCHAAEQTSAPAGHQDCRRCHQPHTGSVAATSCASCHAAEAGTAHGRGVSSCTNCHRAHGPDGVARPPPCTSCHQSGALSGLHAEAKHQECRRCHTGHGEAAPGAERNACLSCHADRMKHFPDAPRCANCHLFRAR